MGQNACLLCSDTAVYLGCFIPKSEPERYLAVKLTAGKVRTLWYGLCGSCFELPDKAGRVEDVLEAAATQERN
jgi:hypothetical protein